MRKIGSWMKGNRRSLMGLCLLAISLLAFMALGPESVDAKNSTYRAKLWINDNFRVDQALFSDGLREGWYIDHLIPDSPDPCVTGWVKTDGFYFMYLDYSPEVGFGCSESLGFDPRRYTIIPLESCGITEPKNFRIRAEKLFGRKGTTTVAFMFYKEDVSYEVRPDTEVQISGAGDSRTLTYYDTATLWRITQLFKTEKVPVPICSFPFPFQLTVERVPQ